MSFVSHGCCNKLPPVWWCKVTEMYSPAVLKAGNLKSGFIASSGVSLEKLLRPSFSFGDEPLAFLWPHGSDLCVCLHTTFSHRQTAKAVLGSCSMLSTVRSSLWFIALSSNEMGINKRLEAELKLPSTERRRWEWRRLMQTDLDSALPIEPSFPHILHTPLWDQMDVQKPQPSSKDK